MDTMHVTTWKPVSERDSAYYIFNEQFKCRVSNIQSMSIEYLQHHGMPVSGHPGYDKETVNEQITRMLTINQIAEFYKKGVAVSVVDYNDTKKIYEFISDHLVAWKQKLSESFHVRDAPIEDLLLLDKLAAVVYVHAVPLFTTEIVESIIARRTSSVMKVSREHILAQPKLKTINQITDEPIKEDTGTSYPDRLSMADSFMRSAVPTNHIGKSWK